MKFTSPEACRRLITSERYTHFSFLLSALLILFLFGRLCSSVRRKDWCSSKGLTDIKDICLDPVPVYSGTIDLTVHLHLTLK